MEKHQNRGTLQLDIQRQKFLVQSHPGLAFYTGSVVGSGKESALSWTSMTRLGMIGYRAQVVGSSLQEYIELRETC